MTEHSSLCVSVCVCVHMCVFAGKRDERTVRQIQCIGSRQCGWWAYMVCILLYSRQKPCFPLLCPVTSMLHQNNHASLLPKWKGDHKNNFPLGSATTAHDDLIHDCGEKKPSKECDQECCHSQTQIRMKRYMNKKQGDGKLGCDFTIRSDTRVLLSQHFFLFLVARFYRFKSFMF